jgi:hypothetical protein
VGLAERATHAEGDPCLRDDAERLELERPEDLGQTLAVWGIPEAGLQTRIDQGEAL